MKHTRFLALIMALLMCLSLLPMGALAASEEAGVLDGQVDEILDLLDDAGHAAEPETVDDAVVEEPDVYDISIDGADDESAIDDPDSLVDVSEDEADSNEEILRYTVLILDTSGSMSGTPATVQKQAAIKFCESITKADGTNYVAIVKLNSTSSVGCEFTTDLATLEAYINSIPASGGTNINQALQVAESLIDGISEEYPDAIKNIVLCSDGLPESGSTSSDGPYTSSDYSNYRYANYAYNTASKIKEKGYNLYTLGFFHSLSGSTLDFGTRFMADISSGEIYAFVVTDVDELEFTFGNIANSIINNSPIIVLPGVMGSKLYRNVNDGIEMVWGTRSNIFLQPSIGYKLGLDTLFASGLLLQSDKPEEQREYGTIDLYKNLIDFLCEAYGNDREIYFFSYDWRQSNEESAQSLADALEEQGITSATFICHSMGGLVISNFVEQHKNYNIENVITLGTPYEGAPKLLRAVLTTAILRPGVFNALGDLALACFGMNFAVKSQFLGVGELTPTSETESIKYRSSTEVADNENAFTFSDYLFPSVSQSLTSLQLEFLLQNGNISGSLKSSIRQWLNQIDESYTEFGRSLTKITVTQSGQNITLTPHYYPPISIDYEHLLELIYNKYDEDDPADNAKKIMLEQNRVQDAIETLLSMDNAYFALGKTNRTITGVTLQINNDRVSLVGIDYGVGDGTVPLYSAGMMLDYTPANAQYFDLNHNDLAGAHGKGDWLKVKDWISSILDKTSYTGGSDSTQSKGHKVIQVACPVDVTLEYNGEQLSSDPENYSDSASFGCMDLIGDDGEIKVFCIDTDINCNMTIIGTDDGTMDYTIRYLDADYNTIDEYGFVDIPITATTVITTVVNDEYPVLAVDSNGDNNADYSINYDGIITVPDEDEPGCSDPVPCSDLNPSDSCYKAMLWAINNTIIKGIKNGLYAPQQDCTRGQFVLMLYRIAGKPNVSDVANPFTDVKCSDPFYKAVLWAYESGIIKGAGDGSKFCPNASITRGQAILMLYRMAGKPAVITAENPSGDLGAKQSCYKAAVWAYSHGITKVNTFRPDDAITRGELVIFLYRLCAE